MLAILKRYLKVDKSEGYSSFSPKNLMLLIIIIMNFYISGVRGKFGEVSICMTIGFSFIMTMSSCNCIINKLYNRVNDNTYREENFYKRVIASNIDVLINIALYMLIFIILNIYFLGYVKGISLLLKFITLTILSLAIGNLLFLSRESSVYKGLENIISVIFLGIFSIILYFISKKSIHKKAADYVFRFVSSIALAIFSYYLYYKFGIGIIFLSAVVLYLLSLIISEKIYPKANVIVN